MDGTRKHLWSQKYFSRQLETDRQFRSAYNYTKYNRDKHFLPQNKELESIIEQFLIKTED
jgi:hypothetical protein